jgi:hypothetical protein
VKTLSCGLELNMPTGKALKNSEELHSKMRKGGVNKLRRTDAGMVGGAPHA